MQMQISHRYSGFFERLDWVGPSLAAIYWVSESYLHVYVLNQGPLFTQIFPLDFHELWKRFLILGLIFVFSISVKVKRKELKKSHKILNEYKTKYQMVFEEALVPIFLFDDKGRIIDSNHAGYDFFELNREIIADKNIWDFVVKDKDNINLCFFPLHSQQNVEIEFLINGKVKTILLNLIPLRESGKTVIYGISQDITERKKMEREIKHAHYELDQIFQTASVGMRLVDKDCNVINVNETFIHLSGQAREHAVGKKCYEVFAGDLCHNKKCPLRRILNGEVEIECEVDKQRKDGKNIHCLLSARPFYGPYGELIGIVESFKNINDLKQVQENLKTERDKLRRILFQRIEGVGIVDADYNLEYLNKSLEAEFGDCEGEKCYTVFRGRLEPCDNCIMRKSFLSGKLETFEFSSSRGRIYEQTYTPFKEYDGNKKSVVTLRDITDVKAAQAIAYRAEQLAALGELAAGVAHEINNPINGIINYAQVLINKKSQTEEIYNIAERIRKEGNRIAQIVESLLSFARRDSPLKIPVKIDEAIDDVLTLMMSQMRKEMIHVECNIKTELPFIFAIPQEIQQVFINFLNNARYALGKKYPKNDANKLIQIDAEKVEIDNEIYVRITFLDHGIGISSDIISMVMNPFFSTKPKGVGTGLGLSISHGIVIGHGGKIYIDSRENQYTSVTVYFPAKNNFSPLEKNHERNNTDCRR